MDRKHHVDEHESDHDYYYFDEDSDDDDGDIITEENRVGGQ